MEVDVRYMKRALQLARCGLGHVSPNPMVGAVIVNNGAIIGEGYHRRFGGGHAEVNAIASVSDKGLFSDCTLYVTLEPCSHYGKTPPCAELIINCGIPRVVVGCLDPFAAVSGRGVAMLRNAGVETITGVLEEDCRRLNRAFITAHTYHRPFVSLKWACSSDGFMDAERSATEPATKFSTVLTSQEVHKLRSVYDAVMVGSGTVIMDNPMLNVRTVEGKPPIVIVADRHGRVRSDSNVFNSVSTVYFTLSSRTDLPDNVRQEVLSCNSGVSDILCRLYAMGITSLLVEGGAALLNSFIDGGYWDAARIEVSRMPLGGRSGIVAPAIPRGILSSCTVDGNDIITVERE